MATLGWSGEEWGPKATCVCHEGQVSPTTRAGEANPSQGRREQPGTCGMDTADCPRHTHHPASPQCHVRADAAPLHVPTAPAQGKILICSVKDKYEHSSKSPHLPPCLCAGFQHGALFCNLSPGVWKFPYRKVLWKAFWKTFPMINNYSNLLSAFSYSCEAFKIFSSKSIP